MCPQFHANYFNEMIEGSRVVIFEDGKHNLHLKYSLKFNQIIKQFFGNIKQYFQKVESHYINVFLINNIHQR